MTDADFQLHIGDAYNVLTQFPAESVDCVVTSPPYWGLRDYGSCDQLGLEATPDLYVAAMVAVFAEVRRVLAPQGTLWLNLGDSYASQGGPEPVQTKWQVEGASKTQNGGRSRTPGALKPKDLVGIPWRVAFALQADGWWLRSDVVWSKPNPMPESVTDRPTKAHEYVFLLTKSSRYFYDAAAIAEPATWYGPNGRPKAGPHAGQMNARARKAADNQRDDLTRNARSVWTIQTQQFADAHFAVFPEELAERCIKAGCPKRVCATCGKPRTPETVRSPLGSGPSVDPTRLTGRKGMNRERRPGEGVREITRAEQRDYAEQLRDSPHRDVMADEAGPAFAHYLRTDESGARPVPNPLLAAWLERGWLMPVEAADCGHDNWRAGVVLDPFLGSGTTSVAARRLGRNSVGIELNPQYGELIVSRMAQWHKRPVRPKPPPEAQTSLLAEGAA